MIEFVNFHLLIINFHTFRHLVEGHFPKVSNGVNKIKCYELFTMHLGLVTPKLQLEHSRRLVATIQDVTEMATNNLFDLL